MFEISKDGFGQIMFTNQNFSKLMVMLSKNLINSRIAKDLIKEMIMNDFDPEVIAKDRGLLQSSDPALLQPIIDEIIKEFKTVVDEYYSGKENSLQFLVGQGMKKTRGTANPGLLLNLIKETLDKTKSH